MLLKNSEKIDIAQKIKFSFKDFFSKCDQIRRNLGIATDLSVNISNPLVRESPCILVIFFKTEPFMYIIIALKLSFPDVR